ASRLLERHWFRRAVLPPIAAAAAGLAVARLMALPSGSRPPFELAAMTALYFSTCLVVLRLCFGTALNHLLDLVPAGDRIRALIRLSKEQNTTDAPGILPGVHPVGLNADTTEY